MPNEPVETNSVPKTDNHHLKKRLDDYKSLFMKSDTAVSILNVDGEFLECNDAFVNLLGYDKKTLVNGFHPGMISTEFQPDGKNSFKKAKKMLDQAVLRGKVDFEWLYKAKDGGEYLSHVTLEKISFDDVPALCATVRDLSEHKKLERLVNERTFKIKEKQKQSRISLEPIITTLFIIFIFMIAFYGLSIIEKHSRAATGKALRTVVNTMDEGVQLWAANRIEDAQSLATNYKVVSLTEQLLGLPLSKPVLINQDGIQHQLRNNIKNILAAKGYQGFFIISPNHHNLGSMRDANVGIKNLIAEQRPDLIDRVFSGESLIIPAITSDVPLKPESQSTKTLPPTMFAASPIRNNNGNVLAVFTIRLDPIRDFSRLLRLGRIGKSGETYAFDHNGMMLTESRFEEQMRDLGLIQSEESSILKIRIAQPGKDLTKGLAATIPKDQRPLTLMVKSAVNQGNGFNVDGYPDYRGVPVFGAWVWDKKTGIGLATEMDAEEAMESFYLTRDVILGSLGFTAILALWMTFYLASRRKKALKDLEDYQAVLEQRVRERTKNLLNANESLDQQISERVRAEEELRSTQVQLEQTNAKLKKLATIDGLTGIPNRRTFDAKLEAEWNRCKRQSSPISLLLIDIDYFKRYNDALGHQSGDDCLRKIGEILSDNEYSRRPGDLVARYGGEEFAVILGNTDLDFALEIGDKIRLATLNAAIPHPNTGVGGIHVVTMSIGVAALTPLIGQSQELLIKLADDALYRAKQEGRNTVSASSDST